MMVPMPRLFPRILPVAAGVWLLIDLQRVWAPSLITIFGQAASTPAELMGLFAVAVVASPAVLLLVLRRVGPERRAGTAAGLLVVALLARIALQWVGGGDPQLWIATVGLVAALAWLYVAPFGSRVLAAGVMTGLAVATLTHAALGSWGAVWRADAWAWGLLAVQTAAVLLSLRGERWVGASPPRFALALLPALLLAGVALANVGRASAAAGGWGAALVAGATVAAAGVALLVPRLSPSVAVIAAVVLAAATALVLAGEPTGLAAAAGIVALAGLLVMLAGAAEPLRSGPEVPPAGFGWAMWTGGITWVLLFFAYYAGYDLGYRADWVLTVLAAALGLAGVLAARRDAADPARVAGGVDRHRAAVPGIVAAALVAAGVAWVGPQVTIRPLDSIPTGREPGLSVLAWNLRMGYGMDGQFQVREVAELIAGQAPDVVLLSEIDRGWLLNGGQDQLRILARLLDMEAHFGPAADPVWGDAILTRLPISNVESHPLRDFGAPTGAQVLTATVTKAGDRYEVVSTHLQPAASGLGGGSLLQARQIADIVAGRLAKGRPLVLGGDLNIPPDSESFRALLAVGLVDALAERRPLFTSPADRPVEQIDHLLVTPDVVVSGARTVRTELSDHLPVSVRIAR